PDAMEFAPLHSWDVDPAEARALQAELAARVDVSTPLPDWRTLAAADVSYNKYSDWLYAAVIVVRRETLEPVGRGRVRGQGDVPLCSGAPLVPRGPRRARRLPQADAPAGRRPLRWAGDRPPAADRPGQPPGTLARRAHDRLRQVASLRQVHRAWPRTGRPQPP